MRLRHPRRTNGTEGTSLTGRASDAAAFRATRSSWDGSKLGLWRGLLSLMVVFATLLFLGAAPAHAGKIVDSFFPFSGTASGSAGSFNTPRDVDVRQSTGKVYVVDQANNRIQVLDSDGGFQFTIGRNVNLTEVGDGGSTQAERNICTAASGDVCQAGAVGGRGGEFDRASGIAVRQSDGQFFVQELGAGAAGGGARIQHFDATGGFVQAWGVDVEQPAASPASSGVFEVCANYAQCQRGSATSPARASAGGFGSVGGTTDANGIAISPLNGHIIAADPANRRISEFDPAALDGGDLDSYPDSFVRSWGVGVDTGSSSQFEICTFASTCQGGAAPGSTQAASPGGFHPNHPLHLTVDSNGVVYADEAGLSNVASSVRRFDSAVVGDSDGPGSAAAAMLRDAFDPGLPEGFTPTALDVAEDSLLVGRGADGVEEYDLGVEPPVLLGGGAHMAGSGLVQNGLAHNDALGRLYVSSNSAPAGSGEQHRIYVLDADGAPGAIEASILPPSDVVAKTATLRASINPQGFPTTFQFEVSKTGLTGSWQPAGPSMSAGSGIAAATYDVAATGLEPDTFYRLRMVVTRGFGNGSAITPELFFVTDPSGPDVTTLPAYGASDSVATLVGTVNPNNSPTRYWFEYGGTGSYGQTAPIPSASAGSGLTEQTVTHQLTGLGASFTYHYRLCATNIHSPDRVCGSDQTFTTLPLQPQDDALARGYELVSPADKLGGTGVGRWYVGLGSMAGSGVAAWSGERFAVQGDYGSVLSGDPEFSFANDWELADRVDGVGWRSHSPVTHPTGHGAHASFLSMQASSEDLSSFLWGANSTPWFFDGFAEGWKTFDGGYLSDWGAPPAAPTRWELFGPDGDDLSGVAVAASANQRLWDVKLSADGSTAVGEVRLGGGVPRLPLVHGLAGPGDPTARVFGDLVSGRSLYLADLSDGLTDAIDVGERELVNACSGETGAGRTMLPAVGGSGDLGELECPAPLAGRDARLVSNLGAALKPDDQTAGSLGGTVSEDGSRVFFLAPDPAATGMPNGTSAFCSATGAATLCPPQLFVRQRTPDGPVVRWISRAQDSLFGDQDATLAGGVRLEGSTPDGDKVFFRTNSPLTADDPNTGGTCAWTPTAPCTTGNASNSSWDLYMYDLPDALKADPADGILTRISRGPTGTADCNSPLPSLAGSGSGGLSGGTDDGKVGALRSVSTDGRRVYFTCTAPLPGVDVPADASRLTSPGGTTATTGQTNLYLYDASLPESERWRFVARLPRVRTAGSLDACASAGTTPRSPFGVHNDLRSTTAGGVGEVEANCVNASSDGRFVTFMTTGRLTVDDPPSPATGDIYGYDADSDELVRITASQGGVDGPKPCATLTATPLCWGTGGVDTYISALSGGKVNTALGVATDPLVAGDKVVFFQSPSRLVPEDADDAYDVYQWRNGDLSLVSTGLSDTDGALYKGNDRSGRNVYFVTRDRLSWQDHDTVADIYTARVGGGIPEPSPPAVCDVMAGACNGGGAQGVLVSPQTDATPAGGNAAMSRKTLSIAGLSAKARGRAARTGRLILRVRTSSAGKLSVVARGKVGKRTKVLARASKSVSRPGVTTIELRLSPIARRALRRGRGLSVSVQVRQAGARPRSMTVRLPEVKS